MQKTTIRSFQALALLGLLSMRVSADVAVVNSASFIDHPNKTGYTFAYDAGNADKLVVSIATESTVAVTGVTYHGEALTHIAASGSAMAGRNRGIWYLDDPHTAGVADIVVSGDGVANFSQIGLGVVSVSGTEDGHEAAATSTATSVSLAVPGDNRFVFACIATNDAAAPSANPPLTGLYGGQPESMASAAGYVIGAVSGSNTYSFTAAGASPEMGAASFAEVFVPDMTAPEIVSLVPDDGEFHVVVGADLAATFSEAVRKGTGNITIHESDGTLVETIDVNTAAVTVNGAEVTIDPGGDLDAGVGHYVMIDSTAIEDLSGNDFAGISDPAAWSFTTRPGLDTVEGRMVAMLQKNIDSPWPGIENPNNSSGVFPYALACLYLNQNVSQANDLIFNFYTNNPIPDTSGTDDASGYFWQHIMWRLFHDPTSNGRLTTQTRDLIEDNMWNWLLNRSTLAEAQQTEWKIHDSENHDAMQKGSHLMCLLALKNSPRYGPNRVLSDGGTIADHLAAWTGFYLRYFKARAMEGINVEIACQQYAKYTVGAYYNIMDFSDSPDLRVLAKQFMDLYWADTVSDWVSSGVRGGGQTRCYREGNYLKTGTSYAFYGLLWGYKWREGTGGVSTYLLIPATSPYRVPDIITAIATNPARPNFLYSSRRFGRGGGWDAKKDYTVVFDNGNSNLRRDTWVTPDYSMGTLTVDMNKDYIALIDQNRVMGIMFASGANDRIMVFGKGGSDPTKSFADISGVTREDCMIVQRDKNATSSGNATQVFVAQNAWNNRVENGDWFFTQLGNAYCAVRPAGGGYTSASTSSGYYLTLGDMWAPVIIQTGQAHNYTDFTDFQNSVIANALTYSAGTMNYTSEAGDTFTFYANSKTTPKVNGTTVNLNPAKTYDSPYLSMVHGEEIATVSYTGYPNLILDFGDPPALVSTNPADDATGVALAADLVASFSKPVVAGSGSIVLRRASDASVVETFDVSSSPRLLFDGANLTIDPSADLDPATSYHVTIDSTAVEDLSGNPFAGLAGNAAWNFTSNDGPPLPIVAVNDGSFGGSAPGATVTQSIEVGAGADMLIVMTSAELGDTGPMTVTYGGVPMNRAVGNLMNSGIWYLDLATPGITGTDVVVDLSGYSVRNGFAAGWVSIDGNLGAGELIALHSTGTSAAQANTVGLTTTVESFNVVNFNGNNTSGTITVNSPNPTVIYTDNDIGSARSAAAYAPAVAAGSHTCQWSLGLTPPHADYRRIDAAAFAVVADVAGNDFSDWIAGYPGVGLQTGLGDDPDGDGDPNGVEAWFGTNPAESSGGLANLATAGTTTTFTHPRSANPPDDLSIVYQWSPNLVDWYAGDGVNGPPSGPTVTFSAETVDTTTTVTASEPMDGLFLRAGVVRTSSP